MEGLVLSKPALPLCKLCRIFFTNRYPLTEVLARQQSKKTASIIDEGEKEMVDGSAKCIERANLDTVIE